MKIGKLISFFSNYIESIYKENCDYLKIYNKANGCKSSNRRILMINIKTNDLYIIKKKNFSGFCTERSV